jgi:hypothetical protein
MPAGQNYSNCALNTRVSAPRYDTRCKIQVIGGLLIVPSFYFEPQNKEPQNIEVKNLALSLKKPSAVSRR